ncbi:glycosyltransferase [uncultured Maribacter sp.]|uniref:glycosyltransferase n=1 Tax=uncultured Maribacter sp. TaxID=431308 RepID=UPI0026266C9A|nr:glycosyltransferase [uncultured Maribacter sp.]
MFISIIIPVYNVEKYIYNCLESVVNQEKINEDYEIIIVDDGSPDNSIRTVNTFIEKFNNIKLIRQKNRGLSIARNTGLNMAIGKYVWFVDSDDTIENNALKLVYEAIQFNNVDVLVTKLNRVNELNGDVEIEDFPNINGVIKGKEYLFKGLKSGTAQRFIIKREFLIKNKLFFMPNVLHEDAEFGPKMLYSANKLDILKEPVYNYLLRSSGSIMRNIKIKNLEDLVSIFYSLEEFKNNYVSNDDRVFFEYIIYRNLQATLSFSRHIWDTQEFIIFYNKNKALLKSKAHYLKIKNYTLKDKLKYFFYKSSPLNMYKVDFKIQQLKKNQI